VEAGCAGLCEEADYSMHAVRAQASRGGDSMMLQQGTRWVLCRTARPPCSFGRINDPHAAVRSADAILATAAFAAVKRVLDSLNNASFGPSCRLSKLSTRAEVLRSALHTHGCGTAQRDMHGDLRARPTPGRQWNDTFWTEPVYLQGRSV